MLLCPNAAPAEAYGMDRFVDDARMHLIVVDADSYLAALVTLSLYGAEISALSWVGPNFHMAFTSTEVGNEAVRFYNRLPQRMSRYRGRGAEFMKMPAPSQRG
jgi:hypothetical protein